MPFRIYRRKFDFDKMWLIRNSIPQITYRHPLFTYAMPHDNRSCLKYQIFHRFMNCGIAPSCSRLLNYSTLQKYQPNIALLLLFYKIDLNSPQFMHVLLVFFPP